jgi:hypothetical protein
VPFVTIPVPVAVPPFVVPPGFPPLLATVIPFRIEAAHGRAERRSAEEQGEKLAFHGELLERVVNDFRISERRRAPAWKVIQLLIQLGTMWNQALGDPSLPEGLVRKRWLLPMNGSLHHRLATAMAEAFTGRQ